MDLLDFIFGDKVKRHPKGSAKGGQFAPGGGKGGGGGAGDVKKAAALDQQIATVTNQYIRLTPQGKIPRDPQKRAQADSALKKIKKLSAQRNKLNVPSTATPGGRPYFAGRSPFNR